MDKFTDYFNTLAWARYVGVWVDLACLLCMLIMAVKMLVLKECSVNMKNFSTAMVIFALLMQTVRDSTFNLDSFA